MRRISALLSFIPLIPLLAMFAACTPNSLELMASAKREVERAEGAFKSGNRALAMERLKDAVERRTDGGLAAREDGEWKEECSDSLNWDISALEVMLTIGGRRKRLLESLSSGPPHQSIERFKEFQGDYHHIKSLEAIGLCRPATIRPEYLTAMQAVRAVEGEFQVELERSTGKTLRGWEWKFHEEKKAAGVMKSWGSMSESDRIQVTRGRPEVRACMDAALKENSSVAEIPRIVEDVAALCEAKVQPR